MAGQWGIKEVPNTGKSARYGIVSNKSNWYIALELLEKNAKLIVDLFNSSQSGKTASLKCKCGSSNFKEESYKTVVVLDNEYYDLWLTVCADCGEPIDELTEVTR